jgi:hypothetical protein
VYEWFMIGRASQTYTMSNLMAHNVDDMTVGSVTNLSL